MTITASQTIPRQTAQSSVVRYPDRALAAMVQRVVDNRDLWGHLVQFDAVQRYWARIPVPEDVDVWLLTWTTFQATELHDYGDAESAFSVVSGALTEIRPDARGRLLPRKFTPGLVTSILPGQIHDVRNEFLTPAISIHACSPRLTRVNHYSWDRGEIQHSRVSETNLPVF